MPGPERRRHARVDAAARCWCEADGVTLYAPVANVSESGLFVRTFAPLAPGSRAFVTVELPDGGRGLRAGAVVVWRRNGIPGAPTTGMGLTFVALEPSRHERLRRFVTRSASPARRTISGGA